MTLLLYVYSLRWLDIPDPVLWVGGLAVWLAVAFVVSVVIGMVVHGRDGQVPREPGGLIATPEDADELREEMELW